MGPAEELLGLIMGPVYSRSTRLSLRRRRGIFKGNTLKLSSCRESKSS
jgi:hypothetical protein